MPIIRSNAIRIKRFRELQETLRTKRDRLLVGLDIAQGEHVAHLRHAHTRVVVPTLTIPNTTRGLRAALGADPAGAAGDRVPGGRLRPRAHGDVPPGPGRVPRGPGGGRAPDL